MSGPAGDRERVDHGDALARALRAEDELERFFALSLDLLRIATLDGLFTRVNPAFERVLAYASEELLRQPFLDLVHPDDRAATTAQLEALASGVGTVSFENRYRRRDGGYRWLQWTNMPDAEHGVVYAVARDVTDAKAAESELRTLLAGQAALRRVATQVARERGHSEVFALVTEEVGSLLGARSASIVRFEPGRRGLVMGGWTEPGAVRIPTDTVIALERGIAAGDVFHTGEAVRVERFEGAEGTLVQRIREMVHPLSPRGAHPRRRRALGRSRRVERRRRAVARGRRAPAGGVRRARRAGARERGRARPAGGFARPPRRGRRRRAAAPRAQSPRRRPAAPRHPRGHATPRARGWPRIRRRRGRCSTRQARSSRSRSASFGSSRTGSTRRCSRNVG